jgi:hypothetical protein
LFLDVLERGCDSLYRAAKAFHRKQCEKNRYPASLSLRFEAATYTDFALTHPWMFDRKIAILFIGPARTLKRSEREERAETG